jgi:hypothetical protein
MPAGRRVAASDNGRDIGIGGAALDFRKDLAIGISGIFQRCCLGAGEGGLTRCSTAGDREDDGIAEAGQTYGLSLAAPRSQLIEPGKFEDGGLLHSISEQTGCGASVGQWLLPIARDTD